MGDLPEDGKVQGGTSISATAMVSIFGHVENPVHGFNTPVLCL